MPRATHLLLPGLVLMAVAFTACTDKSTDPGVTPFALNLLIRDPANNPVPGIEAKLHVPIPGFPVAAAKSVTDVEFIIPEEAHVVLDIYDLEGRLARSVLDNDLPAGAHGIIVAGNLDEDFLMGSRIYRYEMVASVGGTETFRDSKYTSVYTSPDIEQQPVLGVSDANGRIKFTDKTHFPFLYDLGPQPMTDENGDDAGTFEFGDVVIIRLYDAGSGLYVNHEVTIDGVHSVKTLVWDVAKAVADVEAVAAAPGVRARTEAAAMIPPPLEYQLRQNRPNPFN
ncbi:MAG: hypothetical protein IPG61_17155 [bacterium]|nr:hypothetical protein [bacterium]